MADIALVSQVVTSAPKDYQLPGAQELLLKAATANIDGTNAGGEFLPVLQLIDPGGHVMWTAFNRSLPVAAGASANVTWFPGGGIDSAGSNGTGSGIDSLTSPQGTLAVASPTGPATTIDMPTTGVTAGTYGDASHVSEVTVDAEGRVTAATSVLISAPGSLVKIFDQTLSVSAASIDTGAGGVTAGYSGLLIYCLARADGAFFSGSLNIVLNNDTGANYDQLVTDNSNGTIAGSTANAQTTGKICEMCGASVTAGRFTAATVSIPAYADTTADKEVVSFGGFADSGGHGEMVNCLTTWRSTSAITQVAISSGIGNLIAGSRLTIYGLP